MPYQGKGNLGCLTWETPQTYFRDHSVTPTGSSHTPPALSRLLPTRVSLAMTTPLQTPLMSGEGKKVIKKKKTQLIKTAFDVAPDSPTSGPRVAQAMSEVGRCLRLSLADRRKGTYSSRSRKEREKKEKKKKEKKMGEKGKRKRLSRKIF